jgi:hypothetical protein
VEDVSVVSSKQKEEKEDEGVNINDDSTERFKEAAIN